MNETLLFGPDAVLKDQLEQMVAIFQNSLEATLTADADLRITACNQAALALFGYEDVGELVGRDMSILMNDIHADRHQSRMDGPGTVVATDLLGELRRIHAKKRDGQLFPVDIHISSHIMSGKRCFVASLRDMSESQDTESQIHRSLFYDQLTGLPNRETLMRSLDAILSDRIAGDARFLLLEIGIDQMRAINSTFGMEDGNTVIKLVGQRLSHALVPCEFFGRGSGDRFSGLFEIPKGGTAIKLAKSIESQLQKALADPFEFNQARVAISVTAGGLEIPLLATESAMATRYADMAYYEAKSGHRGAVYLLTQDDVARVLKTSAMVHQIREALQRQEFFPVFQPKINLSDNSCTAAECLIRWRTENGTMIPPGLFIPVAESADLIEGIGRFIFLEACAAVQEWKSDPVLSRVKLAVNISPKQLERENFVDFVRRSLETFEIPASSLEFEITETTLVNNPKVTFATVAVLREMGISIAIDDFGTGQSSLALLRDVVANRAKVDRAFLDGVPGDEKSNRLLRNIINLMCDMDLEVTVEGVETLAVASYLKTLPCAEAQGYFFARPQEKADFERFVLDNNKGIHQDITVQAVLSF